MFDRLFFVIGEAFIALRRNLGMAFAATSTVAVSIYLFSGLAYTYFQLTNYANSLTGKFEMRVFLKDGTTEAQISAGAIKIRQMDGVKSVNWIPKEKAWAKFSQENPDLVAGIDNSFPDAYKVMLSDLKKGDSVAQSISALSIVDPERGVNYMKEEQKNVTELVTALKWVGLTIGGLLLLTSAVLIFNAIRLTVVSRRIEVRIMQLVGASYATVYVPFLIEGLLQGVVGGALAGVLLKYSYLLLFQLVTQYYPLASMPTFQSALVIGATTAAGGFYGLICSAFALVRLQLRYR